MSLLSRARNLLSRAVERVTNASPRRKKPTQPRATPKPPERTQVSGSSKGELRDTEFKMKADDDPAFYAWANRVGKEFGAPLISGKTITDSRIEYLMKQYGCKDKLELYELITSKSKYDYGKFKAAYEKDGKNANEEYRYTDDNRLAMQTAAEKMVRKRGYKSL